MADTCVVIKSDYHTLREHRVELDDIETKEIRTIARRRRMTVAEWVRGALRAARAEEPAADPRRKLQALRAATAHSFPTADIGRCSPRSSEATRKSPRDLYRLQCSDVRALSQGCDPPGRDGTARHSAHPTTSSGWRPRCPRCSRNTWARTGRRDRGLHEEGPEKRVLTDESLESGSPLTHAASAGHA